MDEPRKVQLRAERRGDNVRYLDARLDTEGNLHIGGHDLGPRTAVVSADGEYEWDRTIRAEHLGRLIELLGGEPGESVLDTLERRWSGNPRSYELEALLRDDANEIPSELWTWP